MKFGNIELLNMDCMEYMRTLPDKYFDLAIVDPPYGINAANTFGGEERKSGNGAANKTAFEKKDWDLNVPEKSYFDELMRVSKNQIIWGANYMTNFYRLPWAGLSGIKITAQQSLVMLSLPLVLLIER